MAAAEDARSRLCLPEGVLIRGVIFDLDGTLLDTERVLDECISEACVSEFGVAPSDEQLRAVRGLADHGDGSWPSVLLASLGRAASSAEALFDAVDALFVQRAARTPVMPGAVRVVASLAARRAPLAVATSSMRHAFAAKRAPHEASLFSHFRAFVCVEDVAPRAKPHPDAFILAARHLGLRPHECVAVEDSVPGVTAALAAGCYVVATPVAGLAQAVRALGAHLVLDSLEHWDVDHLPLGDTPGASS
jgi:pseudouridine-5'-monophosphatase